MNSDHRYSIGFLLTPAVNEKPEELIDFEKRYAKEKSIEKTAAEQEAEDLYNKKALKSQDCASKSQDCELPFCSCFL